MDTQYDAIFVALEFDRHLPKLDLHGVRPEEVESTIINFLVHQINKGQRAVQVIYGRGGMGVLKQKTIECLDKNKAEKTSGQKLLKAWKESVLDGAGGRCLVLLDG